MFRQPPEPQDDLLRPREVAEICGVGTKTVALWARTGKLGPAILTPGGHRRYRRTEVLRFRDSVGTDTDPERLRMEQDAARLYEQGYSIRQVAARFGCGYGAMRRILARHTTVRSRSGGGR